LAQNIFLHDLITTVKKPNKFVLKKIDEEEDASMVKGRLPVRDQRCE
jgi:hypothetical protein